VINSIIAIIFK